MFPLTLFHLVYEDSKMSAALPAQFFISISADDCVSTVLPSIRWSKVDQDELLQVCTVSSTMEALPAPFHLHICWKEAACRLSVSVC